MDRGLGLADEPAELVEMVDEADEEPVEEMGDDEDMDGEVATGRTGEMLARMSSLLRWPAWWSFLRCELLWLLLLLMVLRE